MKRLSLLVMLMLLVTVGGVYATWNYAQGNVSETQGFALPTMETAVRDTSKGTINVDTSGLTMKVDDDANDGENHKAVLVMTGKITVTFTPAVGADEIVRQNGIKMKYTISCTDNWTYNSTQIFTVSNATDISTGTTKLSFDITADQLKTMITLGDFTLPEYQDYLNFETALNRGNIKILVSEDTTV